MQTDPKFTERAGFDAYDPYSYVTSNPVNFTDPTGERPSTMEESLLIFYMYHQGYENLAWASYLALSNDVTGLNQQEITLLLIAMFLGRTGTSNPRAGGLKKAHKYTGDGNKDYFNKFNDYPNSFSTLIAYFFISQNLNVSQERALLLYFLIRNDILSPPPKTAVDRLSKRHDRDVPGKIFVVGDQDFNKQHLKADANFIGGYFSAKTWVSNPMDTLIWGTTGYKILAIDAIIHGTALGLQKSLNYIKSRKLTSNYKKWKL